jgi:Holliday junction resolvase
MTPEGKVKEQVKRLLESQGTYYFMPVSNGMGRHGIPDIICCHYGHFLAIETKAGKGKVTALQEREMARMRMSGAHTIVVNDNEETMKELICLLNKLATPL